MKSISHLNRLLVIFTTKTNSKQLSLLNRWKTWKTVFQMFCLEQWNDFSESRPGMHVCLVVDTTDKLVLLVIEALPRLGIGPRKDHVWCVQVMVSTDCGHSGHHQKHGTNVAPIARVLLQQRPETAHREVELSRSHYNLVRNEWHFQSYLVIRGSVIDKELRRFWSMTAELRMSYESLRARLYMWDNYGSDKVLGTRRTAHSTRPTLQ